MKFWPKDRPTYCKADRGDKIGYHAVDKIVYSGIKPLYIVEDDSGNAIKATSDHKFKIESGRYVPLSRLQTGSRVMVCNPKAPKCTKKIHRRKIIESLKYHQTAKAHRRHIVCKKKNWEWYYNYQRVHYARLVVEADMNGLAVDDFISILKKDERRAKMLRYLPSRMEVHHIDGDTLNDSPDNLQVLSKSDHAKEHCRTSNMQNQFNVKHVSTITKIDPCGDDHTYDIVMRDPHRNFVANNFIVHNSGKTTIIKNITTRLESEGETVNLCAFAGKAAARLREACSHPASTIHRMLGYQGSKFMLEDLADVTVIVDEASMVDSMLLAEITRRNPKRLVLVGDPAQLPPVGRGQPFHDCIILRPDLVSELTTCYRASESVFQSATIIRGGGRPPMSARSDGEKWTMQNTGNPKQTQALILKWVEAGAFDFEQDVILVARNGDEDEPCTVRGLNAAIVDLVSPRDDKVKFVKGDRVMCLKNIPDLDCWNGTTGTVHAIDHDGGVWVRTDIPVIDRRKTKDERNPVYTDHVLFGKDHKGKLQLAYALSTHKSQGSQYRRVLVACFRRDLNSILDRSLLYTAVTRTKSACVVVGEMAAVWGAIDKQNHKLTVMQQIGGTP